MDIHQELCQTPPGFENEPVPISSYQDTEPVPSSAYQDAEPAPVNSHQEKDDLWENDIKIEDNIQKKDHSPVTKDNNNETGSFSPGKTDVNQLPPIPPFSRGQGLPYAPVDWPNPGDVWTWRVGRRVNTAGFHNDRFLILPVRLQSRGVPKSFAGKQTLVRYIQTKFPDADINAFFASFSWKVPALFQPEPKVEAASLFEETPREQQKEEAKTKENKEGKEKTPRHSQRKRKPIQKQTYEPNKEKSKVSPLTTQKRRKDKSAARSATTPPPTSKQKSQKSSRLSTRQRRCTVNLNDQTETGASARRKKNKLAGDFEDEQISMPRIYVSPMNGVLAVAHSPVEINQEEFDNYLNSLDNILTQPPEEGQGQVSSSLAGNVTSRTTDYELAEARMKLLSLLEKDFPSLLLSKDVTELSDLATKLRKDPNLSAEEIVKLKLIEEIPSFSEIFQENKGVVEEADKFFSALELNKAKVASLKYEYIELKDKLSNLQMEVDSDNKAIQQIDEQIAELQARRSELSHMIGNKKKEKIDLNYAQKMVANSIRNVVQGVQSANSKKPEWERKQENALKREAEILAKFAPLKGFYYQNGYGYARR